MLSRRSRSSAVADSLRLDKFLWFARIVKTRSLAQQLAEQGRLRLGGRVIDRAHAPVRSATF
jgi:ribosome-associated heat shock protein Hsp15